MFKPLFRIAAVALIAWMVFLGVLATRGFFSNFTALPPRLSFALLTPLPVVLLFARGRAGKLLLDQTRPELFVYLQSFRILVEAGIWILVRNGLLPVQLSFEGSNFDVLTGILAAPVGYYCFVKRTWPPVVAVVYNILGLVLLVNVVTLATLSMPTPLRAFHNQPDSSLVTRFPLIYLPGVLVPIAYTLHIFSLRQLILYRRQRRQVVQGTVV